MNHQIWILFEYLGDFTSFTEKKKGNIFTRMGWIWVATARSGRDIVPSALGLAQSLSRAEGGVAASKTPARSAPGPRGDSFRRSRVHLTRGPGPQGHMGPSGTVPALSPVASAISGDAQQTSGSRRQRRIRQGALRPQGWSDAGPSSAVAGGAGDGDGARPHGHEKEGK